MRQVVCSAFCSSPIRDDRTVGWRAEGSSAVPAIIALAAVLVASADFVRAQQNPHGQIAMGLLADPYLILVRDPIVLQELRLAPERQREIDAWNAEQDAVLWTLRNQGDDKAAPRLAELIRSTKEFVDARLSQEQRRRLAQIQLQIVGVRGLLRDEVAAHLKLSASQSSRIRELLAEYEAAVKAAAPAERVAASDRQPKKPAIRDPRKPIWELLSREQQAGVNELFGAEVDLSKLGFVRFRAPGIQPGADWLNSPPLTDDDLRGKVVVVHFYAFGCSNCIHNFPAYRDWQQRFAGRDVVLLGIHTPETDAERDAARVKQKAEQEGLRFPILIDGEAKNWNVWGNSMWPTVYLVDQRGFVRGWWLGELDWQGAGMDKVFQQRIEELLAEG